MPEAVGLPKRIRAFGEMVDVLCQDGNAKGAVLLEELWGVMVEKYDVSLLCAYSMGNFYREDHTPQFLTLCQQHSHVMPTESLARLAAPEALLRETSLLQQRARLVESEIHYRREIESALRDALRERGRAESELSASLEREREARARAEGSDDIRELFTDALRHELEGPLVSIVQTAHSMATETLPLTVQARDALEKIVSDGARAQRMLGQLIDVARERLGAPITTTREAALDLAELIDRAVARCRAAQPARSIEVDSESARLVAVDPVRMDQVLVTLLDNALTHADPARPIRVDVSQERGLVRVSVSNDGTPIDPAVIPVLFAPFQHPRGTLERSAGLGLGLYLAERIVNAHGGTLDVTSSDAGTRFDMVLPCSPS
jgi:signal transduction histidine kinase